MFQYSQTKGSEICGAFCFFTKTVLLVPIFILTMYKINEGILAFTQKLTDLKTLKRFD